MRSTRPPRASTLSRPTMSSAAQSAPFTRTSGARVSIERERGVLREHDHVVDRGEAGEHLGALAGVQDGAAGSLQAAHGRVVVEPDDQHVAERARRGEIAHVSRMEQIEAAVGEDHAGARRTAVVEHGAQRRGVARDLRNRHGREA